MSQISVEDNLIDKIAEYGAVNVSACFNCGTCTATCPLTENDKLFPRGVIRLAQLGQKEQLIASKELWACYYCGECTASCPRDADPGAFMSAARKYAISEMDFTQIGKTLNAHNKITLLIVTILSALFVYVAIGANDKGAVSPLIEPYFHLIHTVGVYSGIIVSLLLFFGAFRLAMNIVKHPPLYAAVVEGELSSGQKIKLMWNSFWKTLWNEVLLQRGFDDDGNKEGGETLLLSRRILHMSMFYGFSGLLFSTAWDFAIKPLYSTEGAYVPLYNPIRIIALISGLLLVYGTTVTAFFRMTKRSDYYAGTRFSDALFLGLMWLTGLSGFFVTIVEYTTLASWHHWVLIVHVIIAFELLILIPFTKFAHILYRPIALWVHEYQTQKNLVLSKKKN